MRILIAPDKFKGSLTAIEVCASIEAGFRTVFPDWHYRHTPMADGGEGTVAALVSATHGRIVAAKVTGPVGEPIPAHFGLSGSGEVAFIEVAAACGLGLLRQADRNPLRTTSLGVGELIRLALDLGARTFVLGLGGSATNDGGAGLAQALGVALVDAQGAPIGPGGSGLAALAHIDLSGLDPRIRDCRFDVACDVDTVLTGPNGASAVFGPQKGATPAMVVQLDANLGHFADILRGQIGIDIAALAGGGAAGGMGAGTAALLGAQLRPGAQIVAAALGLEALIAEADLVITGEGQLDGQSIHGKVPLAVAGIARRHGKPVIVLAGSLGDGSALGYDHGVDAMFSAVQRCCTLAEALAGAKAHVQAAARNIALAIRIGINLPEGKVEM